MFHTIEVTFKVIGGEAHTMIFYQSSNVTMSLSHNSFNTMSECHLFIKI